MTDELATLEDACYDVIDKLIALCVVLEPVESMMYCNKLASEALYTITLGMMFGMMEEDTIGDKKNRDWLATPMSVWIPWANAIRDELGVWQD